MKCLCGADLTISAPLFEHRRPILRATQPHIPHLHRLRHLTPTAYGNIDPYGQSRPTPVTKSPPSHRIRARSPGRLGSIAPTLARGRFGSGLRRTFPCSRPSRCESDRAFRRSDPELLTCRIPIRRRSRKASAFPLSNRGNDVVPHSVETAERLDCCFRKSRSNLRSASTIAARSFAKQIEMLERSDAEEFAGMNRSGTVKIIQTAHLPREIRLRQNPAASQTAHTINLR